MGKLDRPFSIVKYILAIITIFGGISAMFAPITPISGPLGFLYGTRIGLLLFGALTTASGLALLYGKIRKSRVWTGRGLMAVYLCFLFATIFQGVAFNWMLGAWVGNAIACLITGAFWVRWKIKTEYINPKQFRKDIEELL